MATASTTTEDGQLNVPVAADTWGRRHLIAGWTVLAVCCVIAMLVLPGKELVPYQLGWAGFAFAFIFGTWSRWQLVVALTSYTLATELVLVRSWQLGSVSWNAATEIPLMSLLALLIAWNLLRRRSALTEVRRLAERQVQASHDRERLTQLTSHELRTPLTIARGYVELMQARAVELDDIQDLLVVADELDRLSWVSDRLVKMLGLQDVIPSEMVDLDSILAQTVERWRVVTDRCWVLDADAGHVLGSPERLRTCIDTLVENAIRYTSVGDTIELVGHRLGQQIVLCVLDSGLGLSDQQILAINADDMGTVLSPVSGNGAAAGSATGLRTEAAAMDRLAGTGLGLSIVRKVAHARGGTLHASHAPEGGAALTLTFPQNPASRVRAVCSLTNPACQTCACRLTEE